MSSIQDAMAALSSINIQRSMARGGPRDVAREIRRLNARSDAAWRRGDHDGARLLRQQANALQSKQSVVVPVNPAHGRRPEGQSNPFGYGGDWHGSFFRPWIVQSGGGGGD